MQRNDLIAGRFQHVSWVDQTGSTNADVAAMAVGEPSVARALFADEQTSGRGRLDRSWEQAKGSGLLVSFFIPWLDASTAHLVPTALGVAIAGAITDTGRSVGLKWPNDVVVKAVGDPLDGKKLGGMLSSSVVTERGFCGVVAGLGCNVTWPPLKFPELPDATALDHLSGVPISRDALATDLIRRFDQELTASADRGADNLLDRYRGLCVTLGQAVRVEVGHETVEGVATDIDPSGALLLDVDGRQLRVDVGDVTHVRRRI